MDVDLRFIERLLSGVLYFNLTDLSRRFNLKNRRNKTAHKHLVLINIK